MGMKIKQKLNQQWFMFLISFSFPTCNSRCTVVNYTTYVAYVYLALPCPATPCCSMGPAAMGHPLPAACSLLFN